MTQTLSQAIARIEKLYNEAPVKDAPVSLGDICICPLTMKIIRTQQRMIEGAIPHIQNIVANNTRIVPDGFEINSNTEDAMKALKQLESEEME